MSMKELVFSLRNALMLLNIQASLMSQVIASEAPECFMRWPSPLANEVCAVRSHSPVSPGFSTTAPSTRSVCIRLAIGRPMLSAAFCLRWSSDSTAVKFSLGFSASLTRRASVSSSLKSSPPAAFST